MRYAAISFFFALLLISSVSAATINPSISTAGPCERYWFIKPFCDFTKGSQGPQGPTGLSGTGNITIINNGSYVNSTSISSTTTFNNLTVGNNLTTYSNYTTFTNITVIWSEMNQTPGPQGIPGTQGPRGIQGFNGTPGIQGINGTPGPQGVQGIQGEKGDKGDQGDTGLTGPIGPTGSAGPQGVNGTPGAPGEKGDKGDTGFNGSTGEKGDKGDAGIQGIQGIQGLKGDKGDTGLPNMTAGPQGPTGPANTTMLNTSYQTIANQSNYDIAVNNSMKNYVDTTGFNNFKGARVYNSADQSLTGDTDNKISYNSEIFDTDNIHSISTNTDRLTATTPGYYSIHCAFRIGASTSTSESYCADIRYNGVTIINEHCQSGVPNSYPVVFSSESLYYLNSGDFVNTTVYPSPSGKKVAYVSAYSPIFEIYRVG